MRSNPEVNPGSSKLWAALDPHRRTAGLCHVWDIPLHIVRPGPNGPARWLALPFAFLRLLKRVRPAVLFVPNPSIALATLAAIFRKRLGYCLVIDAHNEGVRPFYRPYGPVRWLSRRLLSAADFTIVSNDALAADVREAGGRALTLPDALPVVPEGSDRRQTVASHPPVIAVIATYRRDEPIAAVMSAATRMPDVQFEFTGPCERYDDKVAPVPPNARLTGFLDDGDYWRLLARATVVCDLTLKSDCLVCGAYEALAVGAPMVLSDNRPTRELFGSAAVLTGNDPEDIRQALQTALIDRDRLQANALELREAFKARWQEQADAAWHEIEQRCAPGAAISA